VKLTEEDVDKLIKAWTEESGELISREEAREMGNRVIQLYEILLRPLPGEEVETNEEKDRESSKSCG
jgi:hypothetical protein